MSLPRLPIALAIVLLAACSAPGGGRPRGDRAPPGGDRAEIGEIVAAELAFARAARENGQWAALADTATDEAVMFVPQVVNARQWLKGRAGPEQAVSRHPVMVWASCDGSLAVTRGGWQRPDGSVGYFVTAWQRQRDGEYRWVMNLADKLAEPLETPEFIGSKVAPCGRPDSADRERRRDRGQGTITAALCDVQSCRGGGISQDQTLRYDYVVEPDGAGSVSVSLLEDDGYAVVVQSDLAAR